MEEQGQTPGQTQAVSDDGTSSWAAAAQPTQPAGAGDGKPAQPGPPADQQQALHMAENPDRSAVQPEAPQVKAQLQFIPMPLRPVNTGIRGIVDKVADVLAGTTRPEIYEDPMGNKMVYHPEMTRGQQWQRIGAEVLLGGANGWAAGQGPGGMARAAAAGVKTGFGLHQQEAEAEQGMNQEVRQDTLERAHAQMMRMQLAEESWKLSRLQPEADEAAFKAADVQQQGYQAQKGVKIGTMAHAGDLAELLKTTPDLAEQMVKRGTINIAPNYQRGEDGNYHLAGINVWKMPDGWRNEMMPPKTSFDWFNPQTHQIEQHVATDPMTVGEHSDYATTAAAEQLKWKNSEAELKLKNSQAGNLDSETRDRDAMLPVNKGLKVAETRKDEAEAQKATSEAAKAKAETADDATVDQIGRGQMPVGRLAYLLSRNPGLANQVAAKYPDFDGSRVEAYTHAYQDFTSGKKGTTGYALNAGATALKHMRELRAMNTVKSHVPGTADWNAYHNKVDTLASELATFYGTPTIPAIDAIKGSLGSNLPGTRDAAIRTQAQSMSDKFNSYEQQWRNASPSAQYEAQMPQIDDAAKEARAELDPEYKKQLVSERGGAAHQRPTQQAKPPAAPPQGAAGTMQFSDGKVHFVDANQRDLGVAQ